MGEDQSGLWNIARGAGGKRRSGVALFKSVSIIFSKGSKLSREREIVPSRDMKAETKKEKEPPIKKVTHFSRPETEALSLIYEKLVGVSHGMPTQNNHHLAVSTAPLINSKGKEGLERTVFRDLLHNTFNVSAEDILMERIFCAFDTSCDGIIKCDEWVQGMSAFLRGTLEEKTAFAFAVYDLNNDGYIVREEMFSLLKNSLVKQPQEEDPEEGVKELVELVLKKLDRDKDGKVSFEDFRGAVEEEPLFLEAFGQCLPSDTATAAFLATLS
ncbi:EF-hand calcium-binding domain-containing protein 1 [Cimex lectularius]|uniref:EF-hand domain-containing protein n=1 Tax=Cimex lectularius TaxID=79782 RepID=A0A8I6R8U6_CIMLE|nr:EF-hand calcium-binding domain-containing protein 1 [Cimex lectularius]